MLEEAVITLKKPTIEKAPGRLVFNIENTSVASGNALDVLKKTPGVVVSQQGISVKNNSPFIYIKQQTDIPLWRGNTVTFRDHKRSKFKVCRGHHQSIFKIRRSSHNGYKHSNKKSRCHWL